MPPQLTHLKIRFKSAGLPQFIEKYSVDVSRSGIFIRTKEPLEVGRQIKFEFTLQDGSSLIVGEGTVVWTRTVDPNRAGVAAGMGVRFDRLTDGSQKVLDHILAAKASRGEAQTESRFDAGVRASQSASGVIGERDAKTPLPTPRPGLDAGQAAWFTQDESTRVMNEGQSRQLAASTRDPWGERPAGAEERATGGGEPQRPAEGTRQSWSTVPTVSDPSTHVMSNAEARPLIESTRQWNSIPTVNDPSTQVMAKDERQRLADQTRQPWSEPPTVADPERSARLAREATPTPMPNRHTQNTPPMDLMAQALAAAMNAPDLARNTTPLPPPPRRPGMPATPSALAGASLSSSGGTSAISDGVPSGPIVDTTPLPPSVAAALASRPILGRSLTPPHGAPISAPAVVPVELNPELSVPHARPGEAFAPAIPSTIDEVSGGPLALHLAESLQGLDDAAGAVPLDVVEGSGVVEAPGGPASRSGPHAIPHERTQPVSVLSRKRRVPMVAIGAAAVLLVGGATAWVLLSASKRGPTLTPEQIREQLAVRQAAQKPTPIGGRSTSGNAKGIGVEVTSDPPGALVTIDGKEAPAPTPTRVDGLDPAATYTVEFRRKGSKPSEQKLQPVPGQAWAAKLEPIERFVEVTSVPAGADVVFDGKDAGNTGKAPLKIKVPSLASKHLLTVMYRGYVAEQRFISEPDADSFEPRGGQEVLVIKAQLVKKEGEGPAVAARPVAAPQHRPVIAAPSAARPGSRVVAPTVAASASAATETPASAPKELPPKELPPQKELPPKELLPPPPKEADSKPPSSETPSENAPAQIKVPSWMKSKQPAPNPPSP